MKRNTTHTKMKDNKNNEKIEDVTPEVDDILDTEDEQTELADALNEEISEMDALRQQLEEANAAVEKEKKDYMFLMADFDNFRKRVRREKEDLLKNGNEKVLAGLLPIVDDFERGLEATKDSADPESIREGMELIYNKLVKYLEQNGVKAMESTGKDFDADLHEAIATIPAPSENLKGKVVDTTQKGYTINDKVLRHAKVAVGE
ncbi:MAG: nucleotide exchange factor GrpE [Muribaculaceae bacterium]|nr:nucleotide exchange factor GrpE [Muribaculaceae bacterium]MDE6130491.1 nucleotide exchange factor GrpE [Muribaculaceae bacterium]